MTSVAIPPSEVPTLDDIRANCRLIATFPLSGQADTGQTIWIDERAIAPTYWIIDLTHRAYVINRRFHHLHSALRRVLTNSGWGEYTITPPEGLNW